MVVGRRLVGIMGTYVEKIDFFEELLLVVLEFANHNNNKNLQKKIDRIEKVPLVKPRVGRNRSTERSHPLFTNFRPSARCSRRAPRSASYLSHRSLSWSPFFQRPSTLCH